ncbi:MAG: chromosome segregation protein ScpA [Persephonella sp.]|nr:MAG: chromosome segregation protein ScpA [Persephonella sp.]RUM58812.1 MAG: chromosome segregation protein ScpA [Persephonella sp.]
MDKSTAPFSIVLKLVINGEIDPWNVDIVELADKYINEIKKLDIPDFKTASKIISTAVLLLKMKANALGLDTDNNKKRTTKKRLMGIKRFYTIEEIAHILKEFATPPIQIRENKRKKRKNYKRKTKSNKSIELPPLFKATLEEAIEFLKEELDKLDSVISFKELEYPDKIQSFVALLFLNYEKVINLYQEKPFGEIIIEKNRTV